jgi:hypothetical protein
MTNLAECSEEGYGAKRAVWPTMMINIKLIIVKICCVIVSLFAMNI